MNVVWRREWIHPFESAWSILEKFAFANVLSHKELVSVIGRRAGSNVAPSFAKSMRNLISLHGLDCDTLSRFLNYNLHAHNSAYLDLLIKCVRTDINNEQYWLKDNLHWCVECMEVGHHSLFHQFLLIDHCPYHNKQLINVCHSCKQPIPYLLGEGMSGAFICICGHPLLDLSMKWSHWSQEFTIQNKSLTKWILNNTEDAVQTHGLNWLIINDLSKRRLNFDFEQLLLPSDVEKQIRYEYYMGEESFQSFDFNTNWIYKQIYDITRDIFKSIDKHLRRTYLHKHRSCIKRLNCLLKEPGESFPEICPYAYAYVFWKQSLLKYQPFYEKFCGARRLNTVNDFTVSTPLYEEVIRGFYDKTIIHSNYFKNYSFEVFKWMLAKSIGMMYLDLFYIWYASAEKGAKGVYLQNTPQNHFVAFGFTTKNKKVHFRKIKISEHKLDKDLVCPFNTKSKRKVSPSACEHPPLALTMLNRTNETEQLKYVNDYIKRLSLIQ
ncbi:hypothetical protein [Paenibacillus sp. 481]|uniref:hypothetical protein n=1 Tax=Paenibacillus sp. 481 TaxID=2835869 RepID=UPI001E51A5AA|nr:hypothetical protein [Paenibacillus sp. 481]UHA73265.1 hypothetical protein KIK04_22255 [Paenibacillus sp. 481]